jgi:hypothetical protein
VVTVATADEPASMGDVSETGAPATARQAATNLDGPGPGPNRGPLAPERLAGDVVIRANLAGTLLFGVTAALAAIIFTSAWQWIAAVTAMALFAVGVFTFLWSYYNAVQRSRLDAISVTGLYLLLGPPTPSRVRRTMLLTLLLQLVIALVTTMARTHGADGRPGTSLALGFLVPMLGFGLNGLWAAYHADFPKRELFEERSGS